MIILCIPSELFLLLVKIETGDACSVLTLWSHACLNFYGKKRMALVCTQSLSRVSEHPRPGSATYLEPRRARKFPRGWRLWICYTRPLVGISIADFTTYAGNITLRHGILPGGEDRLDDCGEVKPRLLRCCEPEECDNSSGRDEVCGVIYDPL